MNPYALLSKYYPENSEAYRILVAHSRSVAAKALSIARIHPGTAWDMAFIEEAALLHDIGVCLCNAPEIGCRGDAPYICHGYLGADLLRKEGYPRHALVCERHTGTGLSLETIETRRLPLPHRAMLPVSDEEQLICFADKFFSKTQPEREKPVEKVRKSLEKYGSDTVERFNVWCERFL